MLLLYRRRTQRWDGVQSLPKWLRSRHVRHDRDESHNYGIQISSPIRVRAPVSPVPAYNGRSLRGWQADAILLFLAWESTPAAPAWGADCSSSWDEWLMPSPAALWE